jgi:hypothetical protein
MMNVLLYRLSRKCKVEHVYHLLPNVATFQVIARYYYYYYL